MTPTQSSTNIHHLLGSQLQLVDPDKKSPKEGSSEVNPFANTINTNIADKITLNSLQNDSQESYDSQDNDEGHDNTNTSPIKQGNAFLLNTSSQRDLESSINITTKEGDIVSLNFSRALKSEQTYINDSSGFSYTSLSASSTALNIAIEGDINKNERKSIIKLIERIEEIVDKFNKSETQDALHKIQELNIKSGALSEFSFNYRQSTTQTALLAYQAVGDLAKPAPTPNDAIVNNTSKPVITSAELVANVNNVAHEVDEILEQENPFATLIGIFNEISRIKHPDSVNVQNGFVDFAKFIREIFKDIRDNLDSNNTEPTLNSNAPNTLETKTSPVSPALENTL